MNSINGKWPADVVSVNGPDRTAMVRIPGLTDGSNESLLAVYENPLGDRAGETEILIIPGDAVWVEFECGDPRFPIITGYRTPRAGNPIGWRRWRHANIEITAEGEMILNATALIIRTETTEINGVTTVNGATTINGDTATVGGLTNNGTDVGSGHEHDGVKAGPDTSGPPV